MTTLLIILVIILVIALIILSVSLISLRKRLAQPLNNDSSLLMLQNQINQINNTLDAKLSESSKTLREQFNESQKTIKEITQELTKVGEGQKQVFDLAKQLDQLQDILKILNSAVFWENIIWK